MVQKNKKAKDGDVEKREANINDEAEAEQKTPRIVRVLEKGMWELQQDPEYEALLTPLKKEEFAKLKDGIEHVGCTDSIVTWKKVIIDGHNRYKICWEAGIPFAVTEMEFSDREQATIWMINRQLGRRNVPPYKRTILALMQEDMIARRAAKRMLSGKKIVDPPQNSAEGTEKGDTRDKIARIANVSHDTVARVKKLNKEADEETKKKLNNGEMSINKAIKELKRKKEESADSRSDTSVEKSESIEDVKLTRPCASDTLDLPGRANATDDTIGHDVLEGSDGNACSNAEIESTEVEVPIAVSDREEKPSVYDESDFTYDRIKKYPGITVLDHPIEVPTGRRNPLQGTRDFLFVQGQVHFALKNMIKEMEVGLNWIRDDDKKRIPELREMFRRACAQVDQMLSETEEDSRDTDE